MKKHAFTMITAAASFPFVAFAQTNPQTTKTLSDVMGIIAGYFDNALALIMGVAVVMFVYYVVQYFMRPSDKRAEGAQYVMWSLIGFFVILSFWGLINVVINTFNFGQNSPGTWGNITSIFPTGTSGGSSSNGSSLFTGSGSTNGTSYGNSSAYSTGGAYSTGVYSTGSNGYGGGSGGVNTSGGIRGGVNINGINPFGSANSGSPGMCGSVQIPPNGNGFIYSCQNGSLIATRSTGSSGTCNGVQMPPNGNGLTYSCQNGQIVSAAAGSGNSVNSDIQQCEDDGVSAADCEAEYGSDSVNSQIKQCEDDGVSTADCIAEYDTGNSSAGSTVNGSTGSTGNATQNGDVNNIIGQPNSFYQQATPEQQQLLQKLGCVDANGNNISNSSECQRFSNPDNYTTNTDTNCSSYNPDGSCADYNNTGNDNSSLPCQNYDSNGNCTSYDANGIDNANGTVNAPPSSVQTSGCQMVDPDTGECLDN